MSDTTTVAIYGASDDLIEVEGNIHGADEFELPRSDRWVGTLQDPEGNQLVVTVAWCEADLNPDGWGISARLGDGIAEWPMRYELVDDRPDRERDPKLIIEVPEGTTIGVDA